MLKISKAVSSKQAQRYYRVELKAEREISAEAATTSRDAESLERTAGKWHGKLAEEMNLRGAVTTAPFERLCDGRHPLTDEELVRHAPVKRYTNRFGKNITTMEHRALLDATFSAPKSVSLAAIAGGDDRIREAHRESVRSALDEVEKYVEARMGGGKASERTGKMISAVFEHDTARPDKVLRYAAPQLHTHAVVFNITETADGRIKPVQPLELYRTQRYATAVYRMELADKLQRLGYQIEINPKTKAPEIRGFSPEYLKESSPRSVELRAEAGRIKDAFEQTGKTVTNDAGIRQIAAWQKRATKTFDFEEMRARTLELEVKYDFQAQRIYSEAFQKSGHNYDFSKSLDNARTAIDYAHENFSQKLIEKDSINLPAQAENRLEKVGKITERQFLTEALEKGIGRTTFVDVQQEYNARSAAGEFASTIKNERESFSSKSIQDVEIGSQIKPKKAVEIDNKFDSENSLSGNNASENSLNNFQKENSYSKEHDNNLEEKSYSHNSDTEKIKPSEKSKKFSMDDIENSVRAKVAAEREIAQSAEFLLAI